ncbi:MAG: hypothetical protein AB1690_08940 [Candidatus Zixiibacteriota bacterium]
MPARKGEEGLLPAQKGEEGLLPAQKGEEGKERLRENQDGNLPARKIRNLSGMELSHCTGRRDSCRRGKWEGDIFGFRAFGWSRFRISRNSS